MLKSLELLDVKTRNHPPLELHIAELEGYDPGSITLHDIIIFRSPSGTVVIYSNAD